MARERINLNDKTSDIIYKMCEGNPGTLNVLMYYAQDFVENMTVILGFDDMNMRGSQIWVAYKDFAGEDFEKLAEAVKRRDPELVAVVNRECANTGEIAAPYGVSPK